MSVASEARKCPNATGDWQLDTSGMIAPLQLETVLSGIPLTPANEPNLVEKQAKINLIDAKSALERARSEQVLDFLQLRYQNHPNKPARRDYAISAGFNLPYKGSSRVRTAELAIEKHAAEAASQAAASSTMCSCISENSSSSLVG